jgi:hypothetical protein
MGGKCETCEQNLDGMLQRAPLSTLGGGNGQSVPSIVHDVLRSSGQPLDAATRSFMEPRLAHDFSSVRIHTDPQSAESAQAVNATAYTVGRHVVFGAGRYAPGTNAGQRLLAHELTHVAQQGDRVSAPIGLSDPHDAYEREADRLASKIVEAEPHAESNLTRSPVQQVAPPLIHRDNDKDKGTAKTAFKPVEGAEAEKEFNERVKKYTDTGKTQQEAMFLAMDDMFAERVTATGGKRLPSTAQPGKSGKTTFLKISTDIVMEGKRLPQGFFNAGIDDDTYNCHSFAFLGAKTSKLDKLKKLARKIPKEGGDLAGQEYFEGADLVNNGLHFEMSPATLIYPRWVLDDEARTLLKAYKKRKAGEKVAKGDVGLYSKDSALPHSGKVTEVDGKGNPTRLKSKWGHYSLFEHAPEAVPAHYGKPDYYDKK